MLSRRRHRRLQYLALMMLMCFVHLLLGIILYSSCSTSSISVQAFIINNSNIRNRHYPQQQKQRRTTTTATTFSSLLSTTTATRKIISRHDGSSRLYATTKHQEEGSTTRPAESEGDNEQQGSVIGASLLFAGTAIGAGMLALPAETSSAGYVPSITSLLMCWLFTIITSTVVLEATYLTVNQLQQEQQEGSSSDTSSSNSSNNNNNVGFLSVTRRALGPVGEIATAVLFWFLLTSIVVAYTSEGGHIVSDFVQQQFGAETATANTDALPSLLSPSTGSILFMTTFASLSFFGTERVDNVNRILVAGLVGSFIALVGLGLPQIDTTTLFSHTDWTTIYPQVLSIGILSFGAQNVVPTIFQYLGENTKRTQNAILLGSLLPLIMYCLWESVFLGIVPWDAAGGGVDDKMQVIKALGSNTAEGEGMMVQDLVEVFSACSIGSSMAGASVSLVDFFQDAIAQFQNRKREDDDVLVVQQVPATTATAVSSSEQEPPASMNNKLLGGNRRLLAAVLALGPPLGFAFAYPDAFLNVLENAGLIGGVSLYGLLPALAVIRLRNSNSDSVSSSLDSDTTRDEMPGTVGSVPLPGLYLLIALSIALLLPDLLQLGESFLA